MFLRKKKYIYLFSIIFVLVILRAFAPAIGKWAINNALDRKLGLYVGHIEDFDLSLYRGAYQLQGLTIKKRDSQLEPLLAVRNIDLSLAWRALLHKEISGDIQIDEMVVKLAESDDKNKKQLGNDEEKSHWQDVFGVLIPISVESLKITNSSVFFTNNNLKQPIPVSLEKIELSAQDLRTRSKESLSPFSIEALLQQHAKLSVVGKLDVLSQPPQGSLNIKLKDFKPQTTNSLLRLYVPLDVTKGSLSLFSEVAFSAGDAIGYLKVFLADADIIAVEQNFISPKHFLYEFVFAFGNWLLKNNEDKKVASYIPFEYRKGKFSVDTSKAFWSTVENKWDKLPPGFDNSINLESLHKKN